jgi:HK97 family phage portal protein
MSNQLGRFLRYFSDAWRYALNSGKATPAQGSFGDALGYMARQETYRAPDSQDAAYRLAVTSAWVYSDIRLIVGRLAARDSRPYLEVRTADGEERVEDHPGYAVLERPNSLMSSSFLWRYTGWWYQLRGNAYWFLATAAPGRGEIEEIWPLPANLVAPQPATLRAGQGVFRDELIVDYLYQVDGMDYRLPGENVVHFRMPNPFDWWEGLSPLTAAMLAMQMDYAQGAWTRDFFKEENAIPSAIVALSEAMSQTDFDATVDYLKRQMEAGQKRLFTRSGDLSVSVISQTLEQMQIIESRAFTRDEIDRVYGIPEGLISGGLSGDSRQAAEITFSRNTMQPLLDTFAEQMTSDILPYYGDDSLAFVAPSIVPQDRALEVQEYSIYSQDQTVNENREARGLEPWTPAGSLAEMADWAELPVRLLPIAERVLAQQLQPVRIEEETEDDEPDVGSMAGSQDPEAMTDDMAGKLALQAELKRWRKVALRAASQGKAQRAFVSQAIPPDLRAEIETALAAATTESEVKAAFAAPFRVVEWTAYP